MAGFIRYRKNMPVTSLEFFQSCKGLRTTPLAFSGAAKTIERRYWFFPRFGKTFLSGDRASDI